MYEVTDSKGTWLANAPQSSRKDARDAVVAARKAFGGWSGATAYNRGPGALPRRGDAGGPPGPVRPRGRRRRGRCRSRRPPRRSDARGRPLGLVRGLDRQDRPGGGRREPGGGPVLQPLHARADGRGRGPRPAGVVVPRPGVGGGPGDRHRQHGRRDRRASAPRCRRCPWARCWPPPTSPAASSTSSPAARRRSRRRWPPHQDVNAIDLTGADADAGEGAGVAAADNLKRVRRPPLRGGLDRRPRHRPPDGLPGDQDGLAPDRGVGRRPAPSAGEHAARRADDRQGASEPPRVTWSVTAVVDTGLKSATWEPTPLSSGSTPVLDSGSRLRWRPARRRRPGRRSRCRSGSARASGAAVPAGAGVAATAAAAGRRVAAAAVRLRVRAVRSVTWSQGNGTSAVSSCVTPRDHSARGYGRMVSREFTSRPRDPAGRALRLRQVLAGRPYRAAGAGARRLLQGRRRPVAAAAARRHRDRLGRAAVLERRRRRSPR